MRKVYICSPYRAKDGAELDRNIDYAQQLTRQALEAGLAPITPHLYMRKSGRSGQRATTQSCMSASIVTSVDYVALWGMRTAVPPTLAQLHIDGLMSMP